MKKRRRWLLKLLLMTPKPIVWKFARTYIAGESLDDAVATVRELNGQGCRATIDVLGEEISSLDEVDAFIAAYRETIDRIVDEKLDSTVSVKPTAVGLKLDVERARTAFHEILDHARERGLFVRIDMEDSSTTQATIDLYHRLRNDGYDNVGVVLQAYLRRTLHDARDLAARGASIRLCKGIYVEPREVAYQEFDLVRSSFVDALDAILREPNAHVGIATHDDALIFEGRRLVRELGVDQSRYEFQMLLGVDPQMRRLLVEEGHGVRIYVPYGKSWFGYSIRRLLENPKMAAHVTRNVLGFGPGRE
jgi:proline dehydrogenase